jgi:hypothetical protein
VAKREIPPIADWHVSLIGGAADIISASTWRRTQSSAFRFYDEVGDIIAEFAPGVVSHVKYISPATHRQAFEPLQNPDGKSWMVRCLCGEGWVCIDKQTANDAMQAHIRSFAS